MRRVLVALAVVAGTVVGMVDTVEAAPVAMPLPPAELAALAPATADGTVAGTAAGVEKVQYYRRRFYRRRYYGRRGRYYR